MWSNQTRKSMFCSRKGRRESLKCIFMEEKLSCCCTYAMHSMHSMHERALQTMWVQVDSMNHIHFAQWIVLKQMTTKPTLLCVASQRLHETPRSSDLQSPLLFDLLLGCWAQIWPLKSAVRHQNDPTKIIALGKS